MAGPWDVTQLMKYQHRYPKVQQFKRNMGVPLPWPAHKMQQKAEKHQHLYHNMHQVK